MSNREQQCSGRKGRGQQPGHEHWGSSAGTPWAGAMNTALHIPLCPCKPRKCPVWRIPMDTLFPSIFHQILRPVPQLGKFALW